MAQAKARLQRFLQIAHRDRSIPRPMRDISRASTATAPGRVFRKALSIASMASAHFFPGFKAAESIVSTSQKVIIFGIWGNSRTPGQRACPVALKLHCDCHRYEAGVNKLPLRQYGEG